MRDENVVTSEKIVKGGYFFFFYVRYSTLLLPTCDTQIPLCQIEPRTVATLALTVKGSKLLERSHLHSARSHPQLG
jgi:hypothetical protein